MKRLYRIVMALIIACASTVPAFVAVADDAIETVADESRAVGVEGGIQLYATERTGFEIYSITGQRVNSSTVENSSVKVDLPKGCYIVRCAKWSKKVIVK
ncbi:MAG: T9SS type A sorting domain-containing protein [Bacteroides sp.]|nr:T9SS type A sorting domain-containing protein [Bacteroides sp.]MCM1380186.1 T9SS type A sorting domain-containing protein [Bacteroides sp.]MCM1446499.1 T9SS type A sorting domain-containing protein [Prevotella sp.]